MLALLYTTIATAELSVCSNSCGRTDGTCDDGGPNALFSICDPATDCDDCGARIRTLCSPNCFEHMWDDRVCDEGCNTFECGHNDCTELEIVEHCMQMVPTLMSESPAKALGAAAASSKQEQDVAMQILLEPFNVQIDDARETFVELKLRVALEWDDRRPHCHTPHPDRPRLSPPCTPPFDTARPRLTAASSTTP